MKIYKLLDSYKFKEEEEDDEGNFSNFSSRNKEEDDYEDEDENHGEMEEDIKKSLEYFVEKSKYKYKIIYKNKINQLQSLTQIIGNKMEKIKIKLMCYNHIKITKLSMAAFDSTPFLLFRNTCFLKHIQAIRFGNSAGSGRKRDRNMKQNLSGGRICRKNSFLQLCC